MGIKVPEWSESQLSSIMGQPVISVIDTVYTIIILYIILLLLYYIYYIIYYYIIIYIIYYYYYIAYYVIDSVYTFTE